MVLLVDAKQHHIHIARARLWCSEVDWKTTTVRFIIGFYCLLKLFCVQAALIRDLNGQKEVWQAHVSNTSARSCQYCLDLAIYGRLPDGVYGLEMTHCFDNFGDNLFVARPHEAKSGNATETWKRSWYEYGKDWWDRHPLDKSLTKFDSRWLLPNFRHQKMLRIGAWWADYCILIFLFVVGVFDLVLVTIGKTVTRMAVAVTSVVVAAFTPFLSYRLAQNYGWEIVRVTPYHEYFAGCVHVHWGNDQFMSYSFWMLAVWYGSMVLLIAPCITKYFKDTEHEGNAGIICEAIVAAVGWTMGMIFLIDLVSEEGLKTYHSNLQVWMLAFMYCVVDVILLALVFWLLFKAFGLQETWEDKVMPF